MMYRVMLPAPGGVAVCSAVAAGAEVDSAVGVSVSAGGVAVTVGVSGRNPICVSVGEGNRAAARVEYRMTDCARAVCVAGLGPAEAPARVHPRRKNKIGTNANQILFDIRFLGSCVYPGKKEVPIAGGFIVWLLRKPCNRLSDGF